MTTKLSVVVDRKPGDVTQVPLDAKVVANVTSALKTAFQIQPGRELVCILGSGYEKSNIDALETWVRNSLVQFGVGPTQEGLTVLVTALEVHLNRHLQP